MHKLELESPAPGGAGVRAEDGNDEGGRHVDKPCTPWADKSQVFRGHTYSVDGSLLVIAYANTDRVPS